MVSNEKLKELSHKLVEYPDDYMTSLRENLRMYVSEKDIRITELAEMADVSVETIKTLIYQDNKSVKLSTVVALAKGLGVSIDELVGCQTMEHDTLESIKLMRDLPESFRYYMRWGIRKMHAHYMQNTNVKKIIPVMKLECNVEDNIHITNDLDVLDISYLADDIRPKVFMGMNIPCDAYMPIYSPYNVLLIANDRPATFREHCVIEKSGYVWIAFRREEWEDGVRKIKYYSIRDKKFRCYADAIDCEIGYVAAVHTKETLDN